MKCPLARCETPNISDLKSAGCKRSASNFKLLLTASDACDGLQDFRESGPQSSEVLAIGFSVISPAIYASSATMSSFCDSCRSEVSSSSSAEPPGQSGRQLCVQVLLHSQGREQLDCETLSSQQDLFDADRTGTRTHTAGANTSLGLKSFPCVCCCQAPQSTARCLSRSSRVTPHPRRPKACASCICLDRKRWCRKVCPSRFQRVPCHSASLQPRDDS